MASTRKKYPCPDCRHCQWCSDDRCRICLRTDTGCRKKLSIAEQIALFEEFNKATPESNLNSMQAIESRQLKD